MASPPMAEKYGVMEDEEEVACSFAMALALGAVQPMVLKAVIELDVLEIIKRAGPGAQLSSAEIAAQLPIKNNPDAPAMLDRMLRVLASYFILSYSLRTLSEPDGQVERLYGLAPVCQFLTRNEDGASLGPISLAGNDKVLMESWYHLKDAVLEGGIPFNKAFGVTLFEYNRIDMRFNQVFDNGMSNYSVIIMKKLLQNYKGFEGITTLVHVGGGIRSTLNMIISKYPTISGINFDLPHFIKDAPAYNGVEHAIVDMFGSIPKGDAIFMKWILHNWSDEHCLKLLKNCYAALPKDGKVIACEYILPVAPEASHTARTVFQVDAILLANYVGGKERTEQEFNSLAKDAGFDGCKVACSAYDMKVIEFLKNN